MQVKFKKLSPTAKIPLYASSGAACFDLYADSITKMGWGLLINTGLAFEIPDGYVMKVYSRSGHGFNNGIVLRNATGIIDSDYRGELKVALTAHTSNLLGNFDHKELYGIKVGDRIAQAMIEPVEQSTFVEVDELSKTERGDGGFGSTGK